VDGVRSEMVCTLLLTLMAVAMWLHGMGACHAAACGGKLGDVGPEVMVSITV
jgi:hypothetical protein